ncbi:MAG: hypothetical protein JSS57_05670 [Proteobacteria bacterium]|nr:hypothetical protein [Pseudomonadota bacterium]RTL40300.1 MAG: hypothetical protein EKK49_03020 [Rhodocyclaceae bacterium]
MTVFFFRAGLVVVSLLACGPAVLAAPPAPAVVLTPVQMAYLQAETRRIDETFIQKLMTISGASREQVIRAIPAKGRLTERMARIYSSLEYVLKVQLTPEQKALMFAADEERKQALKELPASAATK